ncbi:MAG TPA: flagellar biosynthetic protein FliQ [Clostridia bacterium]|nr:flagellar biosynthetic protein FliQ [Clostridia bacterium]
MTPEFAVELIKTTLIQAITLAGPLIGIAMLVGLAVSLFQAVTSIHEQTLSFVPKALAVAGLGIVILPWLLRTVVEFTSQVIMKMPEMVH